MNWFEGRQSVETVKAEYRRLAMEHHPDHGGDTATMQDINRAYHQALERLDGYESHDDRGRVHRYHYRREREQAIMDKLSELLAVVAPGVEIDLIGLWLWITGTRKDDIGTRAALKKAGCRWHGKRVCWYWRPDEMRHYGRQNQGGLASLAAKYGCRTFTATDERESAVAVA